LTAHRSRQRQAIEDWFSRLAMDDIQQDILLRSHPSSLTASESLTAGTTAPLCHASAQPLSLQETIDLKPSIPSPTISRPADAPSHAGQGTTATSPQRTGPSALPLDVLLSPVNTDAIAPRIKPQYEVSPAGSGPSTNHASLSAVNLEPQASIGAESVQRHMLWQHSTSHREEDAKARPL
jgi:hypothetical protein